MTYFFTSESVSEGHPDKVCDQISDAVLDALLKLNPMARSAVETMATTNRVILSGEISSPILPSNEQINQIVRFVIQKIGYEQAGFNWKTVEIQNYLHAQSADIAMGVDKEGAGDQGIMFGYAVNEMPDTEFMPATLFYAHKILKNLSEKRHNGILKGLEPDAKSQITLIYDNGKPVACDSIVVSTQHQPEIEIPTLREWIHGVLKEVLPEHFLCPEEKLYINPTGRFVIGGPDGDTGLTGRKIIVDTYGGASAHGGGAFSGKDPSKVDRSAAYMARYLAKNIVASGLAEKCSIQLSYAIGIAHPLSVFVDSFQTGKISDELIANFISKEFDLTPKGIRDTLGLNKAIYLPTASYGHFGRKADAFGFFSWEKTDLIDKFKTI